VFVAALAVVALVAGGLVWWLAGSGGNAADCGDPRAVRVTVAPELVPVAEELLSGDALEDDCVTADVSAQDPLATVGALTAGARSGTPDVWVPDSSIWPPRVDGATALEVVGSAASSPVVLATSRATAEAHGWLESTPGWLGILGQGLESGLPMTLSDVSGNARELGAAVAIQATKEPGGGIADEEAAASLVVSQPGATLEQVRAAAVRGDEGAGIHVATEQDVLASHLAGDSQLVAVYPEDGSPRLDYPVVRVGDPEGDQRSAVDAVVAALTSEDAAAVGRAAGFRTAGGEAPDGVGTDTGTRADIPAELPFDPEAAAAAAEYAERVLAPSRLLTVIDTSTSMEAPTGQGSRIDLAVDAARSALTLLPDGYSVALWSFAHQVDGAADWRERVPMRALDADVEGSPQREVLAAELGTLPAQLSPGGTGLYDTALAAVRAARALYDEGSVTSVVLLTDGSDDDDAGGISLQGLLDTLAEEQDPARPVQLIGVALGPEADVETLDRIARATGGQAYSALDADDLQSVLLDALRNR
jgi:hypothetical protein